jgi:transposase
LSEAESRFLKGLLPIKPSLRGRGRRPTENRAVLNGILSRMRCGAPRRYVPEKYGKWNTIYRRFGRWSEAGTREIVSVTLAEMMADTGHYSIDRTTIRADVSAAGGKGAHQQTAGRSRGGFG